MAPGELVAATVRSFNNSIDGYLWESVEHDLSEARRLIEKHGYGRWMEELEDAETALLGR